MLLRNKEYYFTKKEQNHSLKIREWANSGAYPDFFKLGVPISINEAYNINSDGITYMICMTDKKINHEFEIGMVCAHNIDSTSKNFNFSIMLDIFFRGIQENSKDMTKLFLGHMFNDLGFYKAKIDIVEDNLKLRELVESFGFKKECVLQKENFYEGRFCNIVRYSFFKGDFNKLYRKDIIEMQKEAMENYISEKKYKTEPKQVYEQGAQIRAVS